MESFVPFKPASSFASQLELASFPEANAIQPALPSGTCNQSISDPIDLTLQTHLHNVRRVTRQTGQGSPPGFLALCLPNPLYHHILPLPSSSFQLSLLFTNCISPPQQSPHLKKKNSIILLIKRIHVFITHSHSYSQSPSPSSSSSLLTTKPLILLEQEKFPPSSLLFSLLSFPPLKPNPTQPET